MPLLPAIKSRFRCAALLLASLLLCAARVSASDLSLLIDPQSTLLIESLKATPDAPFLISFPATFGDYNLELTAPTPRRAFHGPLSSDAWGLTWLSADSIPQARLTIRHGNDLVSSLDELPFMQVTLERLSPTAPPDTLLTRNCSTHINLGGTSNLLTVSSSALGVEIWFGANGGEYVGEASSLTSAPIPPFASIQLWSTRSQTFSDLALSTLPNLRLPLLTPWTTSDIHTHLSASTDSIEGIYTFFDRDTDTRYATPGGTYTIALLRSSASPSTSTTSFASPILIDSSSVPLSPPLYDLIYLDGAVVNPSQWTPGMLKGRLFATPFPDTYQLQWFDSYLLGTLREQTAAIAPSLLTLRLPLNHAILRFRRLPTPEALKYLLLPPTRQ